MELDEKTRVALEMQAKAALVEGDLEEAVRQLDELAERRRKDPVVEERYEHLRNLVSEVILREGPRYYLDSRGVKRYAYAVQPEPVEIDLDVLSQMVDDGELDQETFDQIAVRKVDKDAYRRAASTGRLTKAQVAKSAKIRKGTAHVRFSDPIDAS